MSDLPSSPGGPWSPGRPSDPLFPGGPGIPTYAHVHTYTQKYLVLSHINYIMLINSLC